MVDVGRGVGDDDVLGIVVVTVTLGGMRHPGDVSRDPDALAALAHDECVRWIGVRGSPVLTDVVRWPAAMPLAVAGHAARLAAAEAIASASGRLACCGAWRDDS